ncbi:MAG TPA: hypothetical protein PLN49_14525, partial [Ferruginibacter sp.]|nr:hypothetical protein [Ferruginibacter sp.]
MNAIILTAVWGVLMMLAGAFVKSKSTPKYLAIAGAVLALVVNCMEMNTGMPLLNIEDKNMLATNSMNLT